MVLKIVFDHWFSQLPWSDTEKASCPKMATPKPFAQIRKTLKQLRCRSTFDPSHYIACWYMGRCRQQQVHMIFADHPFQNIYLKRLACFPYQLPCSQANIPFKHLVAIFCDKHKVILNFKNSMAAVSIVHCPLLHFRVGAEGIIAKAGGFNPLGD